MKRILTDTQLDEDAVTKRLISSECPNCGHLHSGHNFRTDPGPVQERLRALAVAAMALVEAYNEAEMSGPPDDNVNYELGEIESAGLLTFKVEVRHG